MQRFNPRQCKNIDRSSCFSSPTGIILLEEIWIFFFVLFGTTHLNVTDKVKIDIQLTLFLLTVDAWWGRKNASTMVTELNLGGKVPDLVSVDDLSILPFTQPFLSYLSQWRIVCNIIDSTHLCKYVQYKFSCYSSSTPPVSQILLLCVPFAWMGKEDTVKTHNSGMDFKPFIHVFWETF